MTVPGLTCPAAAAALGAAGVAPACAGSALSSVGGLVGSAVSGVTGFGVTTVLDALGSWVAAGASWVLGRVGTALSATTSVELGTTWFGAHYATMAALCSVVVVPLLFLAAIQSLVRQSASLLLRSLLVNVPLALLLTAMAVRLVAIGLSVTDAMSRAVDGGAGTDVGHALTSLATALTATGATTGGVPAFVVFIGGLLVTVGAMAVWLELLVRSAAVEVAVLFLPLALASLAWPAISHWCRRLVDTLAALVLSKFAIVAVLSLAVSAVAGGLGWAPAGPGAPGASAGPAPSGGGFAAVFTGAAMLLLAAFMPFALLRLLPMVEAGAVSHLEGVGARARTMTSAPVRSLGGLALRAATGPAVAAAVTRAAMADPVPGVGVGVGVDGDARGGTSRDGGTAPPERGTPSTEGSAPAPGWPDLADYPDHPEATAELRRGLDDLAAWPPGGTEGGAAPAGTVADERSDGAGSPGWRPPRHRITSDHLGPKLVMVDPDEPGPPTS